LFAQPGIYLFALLRQTFIVGVFLSALYFILSQIGIKSQIIPSAFHSVIGVVIGLLLVFRTNTSYDRWWEARKIFASFQSSILYLNSKSISFKLRDKIADSLSSLNNILFEYTSTSTKKESIESKTKFLKCLDNINNCFYSENLPPTIYGVVEKKIADILDNFCALERIKDTPIPTSYALHIKISILSYLFTLPFGLFYGQGIETIPLVMLIYFIIGGIEIISNEIENPFRGDPNDLPIDNFKNENDNFILKKHEQESTNNA
jgi:putative membrane protein